MGSDDGWIGNAQPYLAPRREGERDAWTAEAAARGHRGTQRLLGVEEVDPPRIVRDFLETERAVVRRRLIMLDDQPVELADSYYSARVARGTPLAAAGKIRGGAITLLASMGFVPEANPVEDVGPAIATTSQCDALNLPPGTPVLVLTRLTRSTTGEPIEVSVMTMTRHLRYRQTNEVS